MSPCGRCIVRVSGALAMKASHGQGGAWSDSSAELPRRGPLRGWLSGEDACVIDVGLRQRHLFTVLGASYRRHHGYADLVAIRCFDVLIDHHCLEPYTVHGCIDVLNFIVVWSFKPASARCGLCSTCRLFTILFAAALTGTVTRTVALKRRQRWCWRERC